MQVFPPTLFGWGWSKEQEGGWDICSEGFRHEGIEMLTRDFSEILSLKPVIRKSTDAMPSEGCIFPLDLGGIKREY